MSITQFDYSVFQAVNDLAEQIPFLDAVMKFLAADAEYLFYLGVVVYWFTRTVENRRMVVEALTSACVAFGLSMIVSHLFYRDRPFVTHVVHQLISHPANASFPSDHAIGAFVIASAIRMFRRKDGVIWMLLAACIAFSRVWTGVHYPLDVIAGALIGIFAAAAVHEIFAKSARLSKWLAAGIGLYEQVELKVRRKHNKGA